MTGPPKEKRGVGTALKTAELSTRYRFIVFTQLFRSPILPIRRCVACDSRVTNRNLGGNSGRSALTGNLWCWRCADHPRQLVFSFGESGL
jgi:hypothetical protein